ncbi:aspartate ammonia-lyase [Sinanaerobacter sp. ZZT-01]|uniref:aspartate ammonia-lyase n=1 Tax=Sinanaerobacter sp. ZZT-01 TaxID=3111540 RepID=UPI002D78C839|nr:aspartate ammonia-lyase [Sinanaerobacter sp. ZZT-01]WRR94393.1 aspartate ammonia-lyase [Sinanaerobacter sp. ZZT-01]
MKMRIESDYIGKMEVPEEAYYGVQALRGQENFLITGRPMHPALISGMAIVKKAAAITNAQAGLLPKNIAEAVLVACDEVIEGKLRDQFILDAVQGGAGTSANMNANEVIANRAIEILGGEKGDYTIVHPNDHVNMAQSTNDVYPTAGKLAILSLLPKIMIQLRRLEEALERKAVEFDDVLKMGRTQLQDAVPLRLGQSFRAYKHMVKRDIVRLEKVQEEIKCLNIGGTAIGTAINVSPFYLSHIVEEIRKVSGLDVIHAEDLIDATQNLDGFVAVSSALRTCAVNLSKMSNDLRLLSSGPKTGIGEINLPPRQNGSSIMPGKVNPVIPEVISQMAFLVIGNDITITMAAEAGQLELNAFEPVLFYKLFESIQALEGAVKTLTDHCILGITANRERCAELLEKSVGVVTVLCPYIGYKKAAELAKASLKNEIPVRVLVQEEGILKSEELERILSPTSMTGEALHVQAQ